MVQLTERDETILNMLSRDVRVLTLDQAARTFWPSNRLPVRDALNRLRQLPTQLLTTVTHPVISLRQSIFQWCPDDREPRFEQLAYHANKRWDLPPKRVTFVSLADSRPVRATERLHDACVTEIFLTHYRKSSGWIHEDQLVNWAPEKRPDAVLRREGQRRVAVEFIGSYAGKKLRDIHRVYADHKLPYEFW